MSRRTTHVKPLRSREWPHLPTAANLPAAVGWWNECSAKDNLLVLPVLHGVPLQLVYRNGVFAHAFLLDQNASELKREAVSRIHGVPSPSHNVFGPLEGGRHFAIDGTLTVSGVVVLHNSIAAQVMGNPSLDRIQASVLNALTRPWPRALEHCTFVSYGVRYTGNRELFRKSRSITLSFLRSLRFVPVCEPSRPPPPAWMKHLRDLYSAWYQASGDGKTASSDRLASRINAHSATRPPYALPRALDYSLRNDVDLTVPLLANIARDWSKLLDLTVSGMVLEMDSYTDRQNAGDNFARIVWRNRGDRR